MKQMIVLALCGLIQSNLLAAPPKVDLPETLPSSGGVATFLPSDEVKNAVYYGLSNEQPFNPALVGGDSRAFLFFTRGLPEKSYKFLGVFSSDSGELTMKQFSVIVGSPPKPEPKPDDGVEPEPKPDIQTDELAWFVIIEETSERTVEIANLVDFQYLNSVIPSKKWKIYDPDTPDAVGQAYVRLAKDKNLKIPCILATASKDGKFLAGKNMQGMTKNDLASFIKIVTGK